MSTLTPAQRSAIANLSKAVIRSGTVGLVNEALVYDDDNFVYDELSGAAPQLVRSKATTGLKVPVLQVAAVQIKEAGWVVAQLPASADTKDAKRALAEALKETAQRYLFDSDEVQTAAAELDGALTESNKTETQDAEEETASEEEGSIVVHRDEATVPGSKVIGDEKGLTSPEDPVTQLMAAARASVGVGALGEAVGIGGVKKPGGTGDAPLPARRRIA